MREKVSEEERSRPDRHRSDTRRPRSRGVYGRDAGSFAPPWRRTKAVQVRKRYPILVPPIRRRELGLLLCSAGSRHQQ